MIAEKVTLLGFLDPILGAAAHADLPTFPWQEFGVLFAIVEPRRQLRGDFRRTAKRPKTIYGVVPGPGDGMPCCLAQSVSGAKQTVGINVELERWHFQSLSQMDHGCPCYWGSVSRRLLSVGGARRVPCRETFLRASNRQCRRDTADTMAIRNSDRRDFSCGRPSIVSIVGRR